MWAASSFPLCTVQWENSIGLLHTQKSAVFSIFAAELNTELSTFKGTDQITSVNVKSIHAEFWYLKTHYCERVSLDIVRMRESRAPCEWGYTFQCSLMQNAKLARTTCLLSWHLVRHKMLEAQECAVRVATAMLANKTKCLHWLQKCVLKSVFQ